MCCVTLGRTPVFVGSRVAHNYLQEPILRITRVEGLMDIPTDTQCVIWCLPRSLEMNRDCPIVCDKGILDMCRPFLIQFSNNLPESDNRAQLIS
jgi:hypothetical protein